MRNTFVMLCLLGITVSAAADDWKQFRGPNATGVSAETGLPTEFSYEENVVWSKKLGRGIASPVIANGKTFITEMADDKTFVIAAHDSESGKQIWRKAYPVSGLPEITSPNEHASSTPATDGDRVYVYFSTLGLLALDAQSGEQIWQRDVQMPYYLLGWGPANSPIIHEDIVIFNIDDDLDAFLMAVDKYTGKLRWRTPRPEMLGGFATPVVCTANGRTDIVMAGSGKMKGYNPKTGKQVWTCDSLLRTIMTTPVVQGENIYMSVQSYGDTDRVLKYALLQWRDTNQDGKLQRTELEKAFHKKFDKGDKNKDGVLVDEEIDAAFQSPKNMVGGGNIIQSIRGGGKGNVTKTHLDWNIDNKAPSNIASPLVYDNRLFVVKKGGISAAFDLSDGKTIWTKKRIRNLGNYYASPIAGDGKIYVTGENGFIIVLKAGETVEVLAKNDMGDSCVATPAISNGHLYIRTLNGIYCVGK